MRRCLLVPASRFTAMVLFCALFAACASDPVAPTPDPGPPDVLPPNPDGILLEGDDSGPARTAIGNLPPSQVNPAHLVDGLFTSRLVAIVAPGATTRAVNDALVDHDARIVTMIQGIPVVTLVIDPVESRAEALTLAASLVATQAFSYVGPAGDGDGLSIETTPQIHVAGAKDAAPAQVLARLSAAWNARSLSGDIGGTSILVPDYYVDDTPHPDIPGQQFVSIGGLVVGTVGGYLGDILPEWGNLGTYSTGVAVGRPNADNFVATHPEPTNLTILSLPVAFLPIVDRVFAMRSAIPEQGDVVICHAIDWTDDFDVAGPYERAMAALVWRATTQSIANRIFTSSTAGDFGAAQGDAALARLATPFGLAASDEDLAALAARDPDISEVKLAAFEEMLATTPGAATRTTNNLSVGHSRADGSEAPESGVGSDVRMVGENVLGPCRVSDGDRCDGTTGDYAGSRAATSQLAGLAAYLWLLDVERTGPQLRTILHHAYLVSANPGVVDAYTAVLALDPTVESGLHMPIRTAILDVAGDSDAPGENLVFDEHDIRLYTIAFSDGEDAVEPDYSRYDLNGDGFTGGATRTARFDLDGNPVSFDTVSFVAGEQDFQLNENAVTDLEVLCYYAHSALFEGDPESRDLLLGECSGTPQDYTVTTQAQLDELSGIREARNLQVGPAIIGEASDITNLDALSELNQVESLSVFNNPGLLTLAPLSNLTVVTAEFSVQGNDLLPNLDGLQGLIDIEGGIKLRLNTSLNSLLGLENLVATRSLALLECAGVTDLLPLANLTTVSSLQIFRFDGLTNLAGLGGLTGSVGNILIDTNSSLTSLSGLGPIADVLGGLTIAGEALTDLSGLSSLQTAGFVSISGSNVSSLSGLEGLTSVDTIKLQRLGITNLQGLSGLTTVRNGLDLHDNPQLTSLQGLSALASADQAGISIRNTALRSLDGLQGIRSLRSLSVGAGSVLDSTLETLDGVNLESLRSLGLINLSALTSVAALGGTDVHGNILVLSCAQLESLAGLESARELDAIGVGLTLMNCPVLDNLDGLAGLRTVVGNVRIEDLDAIEGCAIKDFVDAIDVGGEITIPFCCTGICK